MTDSHWSSDTRNTLALGVAVIIAAFFPFHYGSYKLNRIHKSGFSKSSQTCPKQLYFGCNPAVPVHKAGNSLPGKRQVWRSKLWYVDSNVIRRICHEVHRSHSNLNTINAVFIPNITFLCPKTNFEYVQRNISPVAILHISCKPVFVVCTMVLNICFIQFRYTESE